MRIATGAGGPNSRALEKQIALRKFCRNSKVWATSHESYKSNHPYLTLANFVKMLKVSAIATEFGGCSVWMFPQCQHSAHIAPGRDGPPTLKYEPGLIVAENDYVIIHGRFSGTGRPRNWIAADVVRVADGVLAEHWDVLQDEATKAESRSGLPMFGTTFPE